MGNGARAATRLPEILGSANGTGSGRCGGVRAFSSGWRRRRHAARPRARVARGVVAGWRGWRAGDFCSWGVDFSTSGGDFCPFGGDFCPLEEDLGGLWGGRGAPEHPIGV